MFFFPLINRENSIFEIPTVFPMVGICSLGHLESVVSGHPGYFQSQNLFVPSAQIMVALRLDSRTRAVSRREVSPSGQTPPAENHHGTGSVIFIMQ